MSTECTQRPLVPKVILLTVFILDEFLILLVDGVVCQMHILVIFIDFGGISFTSKSCKTLLEDVNSQRLITGDQNIETQVELVTVYQQRVGNVSRDD